ncbi:MAG: hypothetical protein IBX44_01215 [Sulfurospirillum sp.]|nr:hypothetical protein [Sulfurospirillum sp.]
MLSAEDIIDLEQKWLKYKIKQNSKIIIVLVSIALLLFFVFFFIIKDNTKNSPLQKPKQARNIVPQEINITKLHTSTRAENNETKISEQIAQPSQPLHVEDANKSIDKNDAIKKQELLKTTPKWHLKLLQNYKNNNMFSSNGTLQLHKPYQTAIIKKIESLQESSKEVQHSSTATNDKVVIHMKSSDLDTIQYLENKFYASENIVFAIMLAEELYNAKNYEESLKWSLRANEIDAKNDKTWFWFAKNKAKLGQTKDAIIAIEVFLNKNSSSRLKDLLKELKNGVTP